MIKNHSCILVFVKPLYYKSVIFDILKNSKKALLKIAFGLFEGFSSF
jgi:hypothetical protein